jgi:hypothetical protein
MFAKHAAVVSIKVSKAAWRFMRLERAGEAAGVALTSMVTIGPKLGLSEGSREVEIQQ